MRNDDDTPIVERDLGGGFSLLQLPGDPVLIFDDMNKEHTASQARARAQAWLLAAEECERAGG